MRQHSDLHRLIRPYPPARLIVLASLLLSIPAFYLVINSVDPVYRMAGHVLYGLVAVMLLVSFVLTRQHSLLVRTGSVPAIEIFIFVGALISAWPTSPPWTVLEWLLRLAFCAVVFVRLASLMAKYIVPNQLVQILVLASFGLAVAGLGFYWLEPKVTNYADGVWLAFTTGATVGYGDIVPSTPASRIFAIFMVLLGYALFSIVTASIAALFVGEDEKKLRRELHADMRLLREEIAALHAELQKLVSASEQKPLP